MTGPSVPLDDGPERVFDLSLDAFCVAGFDGYLKRVNPAFVQLLGYSEDELLARPFLENVHPDDREVVLDLMAELATHDVARFECRVVCADGSTRWTEWHTRARPEEGVMYGTGRDITDRRLADSELTALRHVATLVAEGVEPRALFGVVAEEVARVVGVPVVHVARFEVDGSATICASHGRPGPPFPLDGRVTLDGMSVARLVRDTSKAARIDDSSLYSGVAAEHQDRTGLDSSVGIPIVVGGQLWGAVVVSTTGPHPLREGTEVRVADFTELLATAIANAQSRQALERIASEQAALRRVATLVARAVPPAEIFTAVSDEVAGLFGFGAAVLRFDPDGPAAVYVGMSQSIGIPLGTRWELQEGMATAQVYRTGCASRLDHMDWSSTPGLVGEAARRLGVVSTVATPILVEGRVWGSMMVASVENVLPADTEERLTRFTEYVATAIANAESREALAHLADEQAALRRVATLVAQAVPATEIFAAVSEEVATLFAAGAVVLRFDHGIPGIEFVGVSNGFDVPVGTRWEFQPGMASAEVFRTGRAARVDAHDWSETTGEAGETFRRIGTLSTVATPIIVDRRLWGAVALSSEDALLPPDTEERLAGFTELVATAIANTESREALAQLADEQAALRRVATLVAEAVPATEIFAAVSDEVADLFGDELGAAVVRFDYGFPGMEFVGVSKAFDVAVGTRWEFQDGMATAQVFRTGRAARVDAGDWSQMRGSSGETFRRLGPVSTVATPILVDGRLWGAMVLSSGDQPLPPDTEERLISFTELVATAIANAESREALAHLADEQAALRRVATLVAQGGLPQEIFDAISVEVGRLFGLEQATFGRFDLDGPAFVVMGVAQPDERMRVGSRWEINDLSVSSRVYVTGESVLADEHDVQRTGEPIVELGSPIVVDGRLWGALTLAAREPLPLDADVWLERFSELLATAIANSENKLELAASRRRIVAASDDARRRIERDLHDGTQQRLVALGLAARAAECGVSADRPELRSELANIATGLNDAVTELQEISRGIHPAIVSQGGLGPALRTLGRRSPIPVELDVTTDERFQAPIEIAAYYAASESLANAAKHSRASHIAISLAVRDSQLLLSIRDDGIGGVDPARGSGLVGLTDRIEALGGSIRVQSPSGRGTEITVKLPLEGEPAPATAT